jgi:hypothetical protein
LSEAAEGSFVLRENLIDLTRDNNAVSCKEACSAKDEATFFVS